jgi:hypothetical protein
MPCGAQLEVVQASVQREDDIHVTDHADIEIRVLPILPRERIDEIVRQHLKEHGWAEQPDGSLEKEFGDTIAVLPPDSNTIRVTLSGDRSVQVTSNVKQNIQQGDEEARAGVQRKAEEQAARKLADASDEARREMEADIADRLLRAWREVKAEVDQAVNDTARQALQERASQLGHIESIEEGRGSNGFEVTITVRT